MLSRIRIPTDKIVAFCQHNQIRKMALFGSVLREDFRPDSDVDVLIEFAPDARVNYFMFVDMQDELTRLFKRKVDLHTPYSLGNYFREQVLQSAKVVYERERQYAPA